MMSGSEIGPQRLFLGQRSLVLVGMMGAGKTTIGKRLASRLGLTFADSDKMIEAAAQLSISDIFESYGEAAFRDCERKVIARILKAPSQVVALGGGAWTCADTRAAVAAHGISIWLDADVATLVERVQRRSVRPLLNAGDPTVIVADLERERRPVYQLADIHVQVGRRPHEAVLRDVLKSLSLFLRTDRPGREPDPVHRAL